MSKRNSVLVTALAILIIAAMGFAGCVQAPQESLLGDSGSIILRVNPEVVIHYNAEGLVTAVEGLNDDGHLIAETYEDYIGKDCNVVIEELVMKIYDAGYFERIVEISDRSITIILEPGSVVPREDFIDSLTKTVQTAVGKMSLSVQIESEIGDSDYGRSSYGNTDNDNTDYDSTDYEIGRAHV